MHSYLVLVHSPGFLNLVKKFTEYSPGCLTPFLFQQGIVSPSAPLPPLHDIQDDLISYIESKGIFEIPYHSDTNQNAIYWSVLYKQLHNYIHKGHVGKNMHSGVKQYLINPEAKERPYETATTLYLANCAREMNIRLNKDQKKDREYIIEQLKNKTATETETKENGTQAQLGFTVVKNKKSGKKEKK